MQDMLSLLENTIKERITAFNETQDANGRLTVRLVSAARPHFEKFGVIVQGGIDFIRPRSAFANDWSPPLSELPYQASEPLARIAERQAYPVERWPMKDGIAVGISDIVEEMANRMFNTLLSYKLYPIDAMVDIRQDVDYPGDRLRFHILVWRGELRWK